jgi:hypothetical protein
MCLEAQREGPITFQNSGECLYLACRRCSAVRPVLCNVPVWKMMPIEMSSSATLNHVVKFKYSLLLSFLLFETEVC